MGERPRKSWRVSTDHQELAQQRVDADFKTTFPRRIRAKIGLILFALGGDMVNPMSSEL